MRKFVIVGVGNPIRGDDAIGIVVAHKVAEMLGSPFVERTSVDLDLLELIGENDKVVLIDSIKKQDLPLGSIVEILLCDIASAKISCGLHRRNLQTVLEIARKFGHDVDAKVRIFAISIYENDIFREGLSDELITLSGEIAKKIVEAIEKI